ncbi:MAG TPA: glutathione S-transferase family protein [Stellaceae bacterium]|jgi:glutathione S-transferase|nr:glutathione S-transferase family protein [Stellaceae bacterium]
MLKLFDLAGADDNLRFSPYCWRVKLALAHKRLPVETIPWRFTEKDRIAQSGQERVPVLVDGDKWIADSWTIAEYLEDTYPDRPSLFGGGAGRALSRFYVGWADTILQPAMARLIVRDILDRVHAKDRAYFRQSREERYRKTLEEIVVDRDKNLPAFRAKLAPLRTVFQTQPFLGGTAPLQADYIVFGSFQWARTTSAFELLATDDLVHAWRGRMLDLYDGLARKAPAEAA